MDIQYIEKELLKYGLDTDKIDIAQLQASYEMKKREELLAKHVGSVWQGENGYWYTRLPAPNGGKVLKKRKSRDDLENDIIACYKALETVSVEDMFHQWADWKLEYAGIQRQTYDHLQRDFTRFFGNTALSKMDIRKVTDDMLEDFILSAIRDKKLTAKAYSAMRTLILGIWKFANKRGLTDISVTTFFGDIQIPKKAFHKRKISDEEAVFTDEEVEKIISYIADRPESLVNYGILLAFQTGLRVGELAALKLSDVHENVLHISRTEIIYKDDAGKYVYEVRESPKTEAGNRDVILTPEALRIIKQIRRLNPFGEYMFMRKGNRVKEKTFSNKLRQICEHVGIHPCSIHQVRKTYASKLLQAKVDAQTVVKQMGHESLSTTVNNYYYNTVSEQEAKRQIIKAVSY